MKDKSIASMISNDYRGVVNFQVNGTNYGPSQGSEAVFHMLLVVLGKLEEIERRLNEK